MTSIQIFINSYTQNNVLTILYYDFDCINSCLVPKTNIYNKLVINVFASTYPKSKQIVQCVDRNYSCVVFEKVFKL